MNTRICDSPDCTRTTQRPDSRWCTGHRNRLYRFKDLQIGVPLRIWPNKYTAPTGCVTADCTDQAQPGTLYCPTHDVGPAVSTVCAIDGCDRDIYYSEVCRTHYQQWWKAGHNRSRWRTRSGPCGGRCEVCRWDHNREAREVRLAALEQGPLNETARRDMVRRLWDGEPLETLADGIGLTVQQVWSTGSAWPEFVYALDAGLMATRDPSVPHGTTNTYRKHGCRCPECRAAKAQAR